MTSTKKTTPKLTLTLTQTKILKTTIDLIKEGKTITAYKVSNVAGVDHKSVYSLFQKISNFKI